jgi:uncharacterized membrane protein YqjE
MLPTMTPDSTPSNALSAIRMLRSVGGALFDQVALHAQLAQVEWVEEKNHLLKVLVGAVLGFACLLFIMLSTGVLVMALCWETAYRIPAATALGRGGLFPSISALAGGRGLRAIYRGYRDMFDAECAPLHKGGARQVMSNPS